MASDKLILKHFRVNLCRLCKLVILVNIVKFMQPLLKNGWKDYIKLGVKYMCINQRISGLKK